LEVIEALGRISRSAADGEAGDVAEPTAVVNALLEIINSDDDYGELTAAARALGEIRPRSPAAIKRVLELSLRSM
jgi:HEAT repeat protein